MRNEAVYKRCTLEFTSLHGKLLFSLYCFKFFFIIITKKIIFDVFCDEDFNNSEKQTKQVSGNKNKKR